MVLSVQLVETIPYLVRLEGKWCILDSLDYFLEPVFYISRNKEVDRSKLYFSTSISSMDQIPPVPLFGGGYGRGPSEDTAHAE